MKTLRELALDTRLRYVIVNKDETHFWSNDVQKNIDKAFGQYLVDLTEPTNLCSFEVNYPVYFIRNEFTNPKMDEDRLTELENTVGDDFEYWLDNMIVTPVKEYYLRDNEYLQIIDELGSKDKFIESEIEYLIGNYIDATTI